MRKTIINLIPKLRPCEGTYGLEIEAEGSNLPRDLRAWRVERDGSLMGGQAETAEYVLDTPTSLEGIKEALGELNREYTILNTMIEETDTSGVHVHLNVQNYTMKELFTLIVTYFSLEELLLKFCGEQREGNHFCLRAKDAEWIIFALVKAAQTHKLNPLNTENIRYCSLNCYSLFKFGSIEFRAMRGTPNLNAIYEWVEILDALITGAKNFTSPSDVINRISMGGEETFVREILGDKATFFLNIPNYRQIIRDNLWVVQPLAYAIDWSQLKEISSNPFAINNKFLDEPQPWPVAALVPAPIAFAEPINIIDDLDL